MPLRYDPITFEPIPDTMGAKVTFDQFVHQDKYREMSKSVLANFIGTALDYMDYKALPGSTISDKVQIITDAQQKVSTPSLWVKLTTEQRFIDLDYSELEDYLEFTITQQQYSELPGYDCEDKIHHIREAQAKHLDGISKTLKATTSKATVPTLKTHLIEVPQLLTNLQYDI